MDDTGLHKCQIGTAGFCPSLVSIAFWRGEITPRGVDLCDALGGDLPPSGRQVTQFEAGYIYRIARDQLLIRSDSDDSVFERVRSLVSSDHAALSGLSHARQIIGLSGPCVPVMISRCLPIDCSDTSLPIGCFVQTFLQDAVVLLHRETEQKYSLMVPTSFSRAVMDRFTKIIEKII